jgi:5-methyltetrahydropteroyltriglutamate--homocysteine methyltransferase
LSEGGYEAISRELFSKLKAQRLMLEYDDARSGSFAALRDVPEDKFVVLGLLTTKKPELESLKVLMQRIAEASGYISIDRLGLSPQCGFASSIIGNNLAPEDQRRKLELLVRTAQAVWGK